MSRSLDPIPRNVRYIIAPPPPPFSIRLAMEDSVEFKTVKKCIIPLETALEGLDRNMVDFLYQNDFITDDVYDQVRSARTLLSPADKAYELVKGIKNRVKQDKESYLVLVNWLTEGGAMYQPIVNTLTEEYQRQLVPEQATSVPVSVPNQKNDSGKCNGICSVFHLVWGRSVDVYAYTLLKIFGEIEAFPPPRLLIVTPYLYLCTFPLEMAPGSRLCACSLNTPLAT